MPSVSDAVKAKSRLTRDEWREYTKTVWRIANTTHAEHPAVFPVEIPRRLIKLFTWHGETVLDPFAGAGTTAEAAVPLGRKVLCIDQSRKYVGIIRRDCRHLKNGDLTAAQLMNVVHGDSRDLSFIDDDSVSLIVSSPPYWNKADYGSAHANLGRVAGYRRFLDTIRPAFEECFRVLEPGRKCCLITGLLETSPAKIQGPQGRSVRPAHDGSPPARVTDPATCMDCEFHLQDPTSPETVYLFEAIIEAARGAASCEGLFAFASRAGVDSLIGDQEIQDYLGRSTMALLVGIDAVTNRRALERLRELELQHERLSVRVFRNPVAALFHPKVARFDYPDGRRSLVVGSGNLTPGGLRQNFEAFSVMRSGPNERLDVTSWSRFVADHAPDIRAIDEEILEQAARNVLRGRRPPPAVEPEPGTAPVAEPLVSDEEPVGRTDRFLVAQVPKAGDRWRQVHFNKEIIDRFFRIRHGTTQRVYLVECRPDGTFAEQEVRPCAYSAANMNLKIEVASHHGAPYPDSGRPVAVFRELQARSFAYMLLMPGEPGHDEMSALTGTLESVGPGVPRVVTDGGAVRGAWPACPLVTAIDAPGAARV